MPTKTVSVDTMSVGRKDGGKHWTASEIAARQEAADKLARKTESRLIPPSWMSKKAREVWDQKIKQVDGLKAANELLDVLDTELLAIYCDACVQYRETAELKTKTSDDIKALQAWSRIVNSYAERLGFTPTSRARLVKKIADKSKDKFGSKFD
jgi:P27 family predicted phage terminase small subunit